MLWGLTTLGLFTVKSAYNFILQAKSASTGESSHQANLNKYWKDLWKLIFLAKIKNFPLEGEY